MKKIITFTVIFMFVVTAFGQPNDRTRKDRWENYRSEKVAFLTTNLELTPTEAQKFWPIYNQLEKERWEAQKLRRDMEERVLEAEENISGEKIRQLTRDFAGSLKKEANLVEDYNERFLKILPPEKVLKLYKAENEFRIHMIKKFRDKRRNDD